MSLDNDGSDLDVPAHFLCPITLMVMKDPVIDNEGVSYEREAITEWLSFGNHTSPSTGKPLSISDLRPNRALRGTIEKHVGNGTTVVVTSEPMETSSASESSATNTAQTIIDAASSSQVSVDLDVAFNYDGESMLVSVIPPESNHCVRSSICCVVDISGSMGAEAIIQDENGKTETFGLSVLDVTKHALKTIVKSLTPQDEFSLVTFCSQVEVRLEPRLMTESAAKTALDTIDALHPVDMTNLWGGLKKGLDLLIENKPKTDNVALFLLTDGLPNISPGKGESKTLEGFKSGNKGLPCRIHTFGFGYTMDSMMLTELSSIGGGCYSFIPDSSFVGTVFANAIANHIISCAHNLTLEVNGKHVCIDEGDHLAYGKQPDDKHLSIQFGSLQYGQSKNVVFSLQKKSSLNGGSQPTLEVTLKYETGPNKKEIVKAFDWSASVEKNNPDIRYHKLRLALVKGISDSLIASGLDFQHGRFVARDLKTKGKGKFGQVVKKMEKILGTCEEARCLDMMKDLHGQIEEAFSKEEFFFKWGAHFCLSIQLAHLYQFCNNFKDPGVQHYCSELFSDTRDRLDNIFVSLPPPKPSIQVRSQLGATGSQFGATGSQFGATGSQFGLIEKASRPVNMSAFMNVRGGCFLGSSLVHAEGRKVKRADGVKKGDKVITGSGTVDEVECVLKTLFDPSEPETLYKVNQFLVTTEWHPVKVGSVWEFPVEMGAEPVQVCTDSVYSFLLKGRGTILIGDVECATLAHGLKGKVIQHSFLGTEKVVEDLKQIKGFRNGLVEVLPESFERDAESGEIAALVDLF